MLESYLSSNDRIILVLLLIDSRRGILDIDQIMIDWLTYFRIYFAIILTKTDKISAGNLLRKKKNISDNISDIPVISFSAKSKNGRTDILDLIDKNTMMREES